MTPADAIAPAELAEREMAYRLQFAREMFKAGRRAAEAETGRRWQQIAGAAVSGPAHAEIGERRWGPGGKEHFADARPGGFPGRAAQAEAEPGPEPELEAST